jgi:hypothetical protein
MLIGSQVGSLSESLVYTYKADYELLTSKSKAEVSVIIAYSDQTRKYSTNTAVDSKRHI